jgi:uncharacterized damage-inducible protein DinB
MKKLFRKGAIGALMDEYQRAGSELKNLVVRIHESDFEKLVDPNTKDDDCRSVKTIVSHVINSGYGYANYIRDWNSISVNSPARRLYAQNEFIEEFDKMIEYKNKTLEGKWALTDEEIMKVKINSRWGPEYNIEQLMEHAIVHILRHRRQIEKFISSGRITIK